MVSRSRLIAGLLLGTTLLPGCSGSPIVAEPANAGICAPVPPPRREPAANSYEQAVHRDECLHRWAYRLAPSRDAADLVAGAVVGACRPQVDRSASLLAQGDEAAEAHFITEMDRVARERALYRVVQARAGNCS